jgi:hypothetical protein
MCCERTSEPITALRCRDERPHSRCPLHTLLAIGRAVEVSGATYGARDIRPRMGTFFTNYPTSAWFEIPLFVLEKRNGLEATK